MGLQIGAGLWTLQSTAAAPRPFPVLYRDLIDRARRVEDLGFASLWLAEHRFWYDGWCPAPLVAAAAAVAATERLRFGTAMVLLPQQDPLRFAETVATLDRLSGGRIDLGVGLGHRDAEFDGLGIRRSSRGLRMDDALDILLGEWSARPLPADAEQFAHPGSAANPAGARSSCPAVWVGGMAPVALRRAARLGLSYLLPQTMYPDEVVKVVDLIRREAASARRPAGRIGMLKDAWLTTSVGQRDEFTGRLRNHYMEESGAWWVLKGSYTGFERRDLLDRQLGRITDTALVGTPDEMAERLAVLHKAGADLVVLRFNFDVTSPREVDDQLAGFARDVLPAVTGVNRTAT